MHTLCCVSCTHLNQLACSMSGHNTETKHFPTPKKVLTCHSKLNHGFFHLFHAKFHKSKIFDLRKEGYEITLICDHEPLIPCSFQLSDVGSTCILQSFTHLIDLDNPSTALPRCTAALSFPNHTLGFKCDVEMMGNGSLLHFSEVV